MFVINEIYSERKRKNLLSLAPECTCSVYYAEYIHHVNMYIYIYPMLLTYKVQLSVVVLVTVAGLTELSVSQ